MSYDPTKELGPQIDADLDRCAKIVTENGRLTISKADKENIIVKIDDYKRNVPSCTSSSIAHLASRIDRHLNDRRQGSKGSKGSKNKTAPPISLSPTELEEIGNIVDNLVAQPLLALSGRDAQVVHAVLCRLEATEGRPYVQDYLRRIEENAAKLEEQAALELLLSRYSPDDLAEKLAKTKTFTVPDADDPDA